MLSTLYRWLVPTASAQQSLQQAYQKYCEPLGVCFDRGGAEGLFIIIAQRFAILVLSLTGFACVLVIIYGAIRIIATGASEQNQDEGRKAITTALIGLVFSILGVAIVQFVSDFVGANFG